MKKPATKTPKRPATKTKAKAKAKAKPQRRAVRADAPGELDPQFAKIAQAFAKERAVTSGRMMSSFGLKVGGKIFAMLSRDAFVVKLPKARVDELVRAKQGVYFDPRKDGRLMKEWISIADRKAPWLELAQEAFRFVKTGR